MHRDNPPRIWAWALGATLVVSGCNLDKAPSGSNNAIEGDGSSNPPDETSESGATDLASLSRVIITPGNNQAPTLPAAIITPPGAAVLAAVCGNGVHEDVEPCDPSVDGCCAADCSGPLPSGTLCRAADGDCDLAEVCNGESGACPADRVASVEQQCRAASGEVCDAAEHCTGESKTCPEDAPEAAGVICRPPEPGMPCDAAERCDGESRDCPEASIAIAPQGTVCRPAETACDNAETCTGASFDCPADVPAAPGTQCRAQNGVCDAVESCDGVSRLCPDDDFITDENPCRPVAEGAACDLAERCDGSGPDCPPDDFAPSDVVCRGAEGGDCDAEELCTGDDAFCPPDVRLPSGAECNGGLGTCSADICCPGVTRAGADQLCTAAAGKVVFVTSANVAGNVGMAGADKLCNDAARSANLDGGFRAWLSDNSLRVGNNAIDRIGEGPYVRVDGMPVAAGISALKLGTGITNGISLSEWGVGRNVSVWTGTGANGVVEMTPAGLQAACSDWTSNAPTVQGQAGLSTTNKPDWTANGFPTCDQPLALYCFPAKPPAEALVFVTSGLAGLGDGLTGLATADATCNAAAARANLGHRFVAWMSDAQTNAIDRVVDRPYVLVDGRPAIDSFADQATYGVLVLRNPINVTESGTALSVDETAQHVWTGTSEAGLAAGHCNNWRTSADRDGTKGSYSATDGRWTELGAAACNGPGRLYCFQAD